MSEPSCAPRGLLLRAPEPHTGALLPRAGGLGRGCFLLMGVLLLGLWPAPLLEVMQVSVRQLVEHVMTGKLPI